MRRGTRLLIGVLVFAIPFVTGCSGTPTPAASSPTAHVRVVASIGPLGYLASRVGGDRVEVTVLMGPGTSPHDFEPTPTQMRELQKADVLVLNGLGLEFWADRVVASLDNPDLHVVVTSEGLYVLQNAGGRGGNPHVWLDPINAAFQAARIRDALIAVDPAGKPTYLANTAQLVEELKVLDRELMLRFSRLPDRRFASLHAAWAYFARRYALEEALVLEETPGEEPTPRELARLIDLAREAGLRVVVVEPQLSAKVAEAVSQEAGLRLVVMDPIGQPPTYDYFQLMRENAKALAKALGEAP